ncbi:MAG: 4-alpha-glucanotransferase [Eubacteriaceae bacterium]|nr:4-alpha-glucanotransferase [Eubacteriaceae bacterium]
MNIYHNSRIQDYRKPFGAIAVNGTVTLKIDIFDEEKADAVLRVWIDGEGESYYPMQKERLDDRWRYSCSLKCDKEALYWYSFRIDRGDGSCVYYGAKEGRTGGEGQLYFGMPPSFQITAYRERKLPEWYKSGIAYQIFPDRYCRGKDFDGEEAKAKLSGRKGPGRILRENWNETPSYDKEANGRIANWDFFGGTLNGIREKLDHLAGMGITVLYLNPIFEAASNHRYDTADYMKVDSLLGTEEDFVNLCREAEEKGISIILDGVFNHTGCDSKYFNKYENYTEKGAWQGEESEYADWFNFREDGSYECWWGVDDLPSVNENSESYRKFIFDGDDSVVRKWLRLGAKGWRLDVADELPDDFIAGIKNAIIEEKGSDGLLMGEVWEDASHKVSYGQLRKYFQGEELDCVMNYPFRDGIESFLTYKMNAYELTEGLMSLYENYPKENFYGNLNLLGSHDRMRVLTLLGDAPDEGSLSPWDREHYKLNQGQKDMALGRLWLAALIQMTMPGVPCIYYGDEAGVEGYSDPYNRKTFPWGNEDENAGNIYRNAISLRKMYRVLVDGDFTPVAFNDDVFGLYRRNSEESALIIINRSLHNHYDIRVKAEGKATDVIERGVLQCDEEGCIKVHIGQLGSALIHFSGDNMAMDMERGSGVLAHITSIPGGTLGEPARRFIDHLWEGGQKYWQILPLNPADFFGSPYSGRSAMAGNLKLTGLSEDEFRSLYENMTPEEERNFEAFRNKQKGWLMPYAMFCVLKEEFQERAMQSWPDKYHRYSEIMYKDETLSEKARFHMFCQYIFQKMWTETRSYANSKGIKIIGDMPMFVSSDSADVWAEPEMFKLDEEGYPAFGAGVPPDYFSKDGQLWGNPIYRWDVMEKDGFSWWMRRFARCMELYDYTRLDHFRGFEAYWETPKGKKATEGHWVFCPGIEMFRTCAEKFGKLPFVAEDLGTIVPGVKALMDQCGFYGTDVMQFSDTDPLKEYLPVVGKIAYSGTHDNQTLRGWAVDRYCDGCMDKADETVDILKEKLYSSRADIVIMPLQDVLNLGDEARMNVPGVAEGNWTWQAKEENYGDAWTELRRLTQKSGRI